MKVSKIFSFTTSEKKNTFYGVILCVTLCPTQKSIWVIMKFVKRYPLKIQLYAPTSKRFGWKCIRLITVFACWVLGGWVVLLFDFLNDYETAPKIKYVFVFKFLS